MESNWAEEAKSLFKTPLGQELLRSLKEDLYGSIMQDAMTADTQEHAYGLLKQAQGVIKSMEHLQFLSVTSSDKGSKE